MTTDAENAPHDEPTPQEPMAIELNLAIFEKLARLYGWTSNKIAATAIGVSEKQVERVRAGKSRPGTGFVAGLLTVAEEAGFRRLFRVVRKSDPIRKD